MSLHEHHGLSLSQAYATSVTQFRALRSEHHIATRIATAEAEAYGAEFGMTEIEKGFLKEEEHLKSWETSTALGQESLEARKRWKAVVDRKGNVGAWTRGEQYVRLWREGIRPNYVLSLSETVRAQEKSGDFMELQRQIGRPVDNASEPVLEEVATKSG